MYIPLGGVPIENPRPLIKFPSGAKITFAHLQLERDKYAWQGSQVPLLCCEISTPVLMADGTYKKVSDLKIGDLVKTLEGDCLISGLGKERLEDCVKVELPDGSTQIQSKNHQVLTKFGWISYDKLCESTQCHNNPIPFSYTHNLYQNLDINHFEFFPAKAHIQGFFGQRHGFPQLSLEQCDYHNLNELRPFWFSEPIENHSVGKFAGRFLQKCRSSWRFRGIRSGCHQRKVKRFRLLWGRQFLQDCVCSMVLPNREIFFSKFRQSISINEQLVSNHLFHVMPFQPARALVEPMYGLVLRHGEVRRARGVIRLADFPEHYSTCYHQCDEQVLRIASSDQEHVQQLNDAVVHIPKNLLLDGQGTIHISNRNGLRYFHPYTGEERFAEVNYAYQPLKITPVGKYLVRDITVSGANHYITKSGLINKNCWDEITHFTADQFWYMLSRNRSTCGVRPYIRGTTNPDADSWVAKFIQWFWDPETGYAIPERSGKIRYFTRMGDEIIWGNTPDEVVRQSPDIIPEQVKSFSFIASKLSDNKILMEKDPGYLGALRALGNVERERLENGNWLIRPAAGAYFKRSQVEVVNAIPHNVIEWVRSWDLAATVPSTANPDPDATAGVLMGRLDNGMFIVADVQHAQVTANEVRKLTRNIATIDRARYKYVRVTVPQDPGQAGKDQAASYIKHLAGFNVSTIRPSGNKITRAEPFSAQWQAGNVLVLAGPWNEKYFSELEAFPESAHDDMVDASSDAFNTLATITSWGGFVS